ncbi:MarR family transcriptional regulator [Streptomyces caniscabiei]|uniref:MarR family winged helix-turn-helix transcriptional regulator n=1 Tax=Streptomyces caniscabiei TaxID=2746961 RepID=UPI0029BB73BD|nr:MarR family transcriptional regulator [Streptomyces caniscabiei]MDX2775824.1 MarR family transcriptional regulator [Streptomyces caniscabiei]
MTKQTLESTTYWLLVQTAIRTKHDFARLAELYDLSVMQLITLCSLQPGIPTPMNQISCLLACDASNITGIVDRLVRRGLIERTESPEDRRVKVVLLTDKGAYLRDHVIQEVVTTQPESMANLSREEFEQLNILLTKALLPKPKTA